MNKIVILFISVFHAVLSFATVINIGDYGLKPNTDKNAIPYLEKALNDAKQYSSCTIIFSKGTYHFHPEMPDGYSDNTHIANKITGHKNLTIDGKGAEFIYHGKTIPFIISDCENLVFKNFSIDYQRPMVTQGEFVLVSDTAIHLKIDKEQYPYEIIDNKVWYIGEGWRSDKCKYNQLFDKQTGNIIPKTHDDPVGDFYTHCAIEVKPGIISFKGPFNWTTRPEVSNVITMYNYIYAANTFQFQKCKNIVIENISIYHGGSLAVFGTTSENVTIDNLDIVARESKGRLFSNMADGIHLKGCKGLIKIENCEYNGSGDDFVNVHNMYGVIENRLSENKLLVRSFKAFTFSVGDSVWLVDHHSGKKFSTNKIKAINLVSGREWAGEYELEFYDLIPSSIEAKDLIESREWLAQVLIRNNKIFKRHRGSGIRVTTPQKVVIERNYFNTAGHAILIEGDLDGWLESGAVEDLVIKNNVFDNCLTSGSVTGSRWEWGEAIIDITPSIKPIDDNAAAFHRNIIITGNKFRFFDYPVLRARSVENLQFINNSLKRSYVQQPYTVVKSNFLLEGCRKVKISGNKFSNDFLGKNISTTFMIDTDIELNTKQGLKLENDGYKYTNKLEW
jgi:hypothetical protein